MNYAALLNERDRVFSQLKQEPSDLKLIAKAKQLNNQVETVNRLAGPGLQASQEEIDIHYKTNEISLSNILNKDLSYADTNLKNLGRKYAEKSAINAEGFHLPLHTLNGISNLYNAYSAGSSGSGQELISKNKADFIYSLSKRTNIFEMGAVLMPDLVGNIEFGAFNGVYDMNAVTETQAAPEFDLNTANRTLSPERGSVYGVYSKTLSKQSNYNIAQILMQELQNGIASHIEQHAINNILTNAGTVIEIGADGGAISYAKAIELINDLDTMNYSADNAFVYTSPGVRGQLMGTKIDTGSGRFAWEVNTPNLFMGFPARVSNHVPSNLTKGSGSNLSAMILGDFSQLVVGLWGGVDIIVDDISHAKTGQVEVIMNYWFDTVLKRPEAFSVIKDISL